VISVSVCLSIYVRACVCVCVFVCPRSYLRNYTFDLHQISVHFTYDRGSVLLWWRGDTLYTFGFMDDVIFAHNPSRRRRLAEAQRTCSLGLGYKRRSNTSCSQTDAQDYFSGT